MAVHSHTSYPCSICGYPLSGKEAIEFLTSKNKKMSTFPQLTSNNGELFIEGDFEFEFSPILMTSGYDNQTPIRKISFDWCGEVSNLDIETYGEEKIIELFAEKLKQDFIKQAKQK